ncbi:MAG: hypothetical protein AAGD01_13450 [Acidobacteriota bacterium]
MSVRRWRADSPKLAVIPLKLRSDGPIDAFDLSWSQLLYSIRLRS